MSAIVGSEGLLPTFSAISSGKTVLLANKESLVMVGNLQLQRLENLALVLPVDSEHNAIFNVSIRPMT